MDFNRAVLGKGFFTLSAIVFLASACAVGGSYGSGPSVDASSYDEESWSLSSTATPIYLDDNSRPGYLGKAAIYTYSLTAKGARIGLAPGENRGVFQTRRGSIIAMSLGVRISLNGGTSSFIYIADFTDKDLPDGWTYEISDRGTFRIDRRSGPPLSVSLTGGSTGTKIQILADGETMRATVNDLYLWRILKMIDGGADIVHFGPEEYYIMGSAAEDNTQPEENSFGTGQVFFKVNSLSGAYGRREPDYAALVVARGSRLSDRIPVRGSGYTLVWNPTDGYYNIVGPGGEMTAPAPARRTAGVTFASPRSYKHPSGRFTVDIPSNWEIDDLTKDPKLLKIRANDPEGYAWLNIYVIEAGETLSAADLADDFANHLELENFSGIFDYSLDTPLTRLEGGGLAASFRGFRRNPDMEGRGVDNQVFGTALITQKNGIISIISLKMMREDWPENSARVTAIYQSLRIAGYRP